MRGLVNQAGGIQNFFGDGSDGTIPVLSAITTAPNGGTVANLWDMNAGTVFTTGSLTSASDCVVFQIDFGNPAYFNASFILYIAAISTGASRLIRVETSDDNVTWTLTHGGGSISTSPTHTAFDPTVPLSRRYLRVKLLAGGSSCTFSCVAATINNGGSTIPWNIVFPSTLNGAAVIKQYSSLTLPVGYSMTVSNPCQGLIIYCQGEAVINGTIDMSQKAGLAPNGNIIPMPITKKATITSKTSSLLHFDNNITDANGRTWTNNGAATFDATNKKFGTHAISFNGTNQWIDTPVSDDFSFGQDDFTIDFWVRPTANTKYIFADMSSAGTSGDESITCDIMSTNKVHITIRLLNASLVSLISTTALTLNSSFYHIACVRVNGWALLFIDGMLESSVYVYTMAKNRYKFTIGRWGEYSASYFSGQIDEFRIVKGKAMYTANFSVPTAEYTYTATYTDTPKTLEKYLQLTTVLQPLRGGYGGNGGYGGGYSGSTVRQTGVGVGGSGRINQGGFGGGGSGGAGQVGGGIQRTGQAGGSIPFSELGGGRGYSFLFGLTNSQVGAFSAAYQGAGGTGSGTNATTLDLSVPAAGTCYGGGGGGRSGVAGGTAVGNSGNGEYSGGFLLLAIGGGLSGTGVIKSEGGKGGDGATASGLVLGGGGGGGGGGSGGGVIQELYAGANTFAGTRSVAGGTGGAAGPGGGGGEAGGAGTSGSLGTIHIQQVS